MTSLFITNDSVISSKNKKALAQTTSYQNADPNCYFQTEDGRNLNLGALCKGKSQRIPILNNQKDLIISDVTIIKERIGEKNIYYVAGVITNKGSNPQSYVEVRYNTYKQIDGSIKIAESNNTFVKNVSLYPGQSTAFKSRINRNLDFMVIKSLDSIESGFIAVNTCYGSSIEKRDLCKRIKPNSIQELN